MEFKMEFKNHATLMKGETWSLEYWQLSCADSLFSESKSLPLSDHPCIESTKSRAKRSVGVFSDVGPGYFISKQSNFFLRALPLTDMLRALLAGVNTLYGSDNNTILVNKYSDGNDFIGPHCDEASFNGLHGVLTISLGATRTYRLTSRESAGDIKDIRVQHGDVLLMKDDLQWFWTHEVPKDPECKDMRISLTFRRVLPDVAHQVMPKSLLVEKRLKKRCLQCERLTTEKHSVCPECFEKKSYKCPTCQAPVGAPWQCIQCFLAEKHKAQLPVV
jgi:alkylated DNA repair dioxygenase AlkB